MKKPNPLISVVTIVIVFTIFGAWLYGQQSSTTTLATPTATPAWFLVNNSTLVTITVAIPGSNVLPTSVNLLRVGANSVSTVLGTLNDDGENGDLVAGDGIYSISLPFNSSTAGSQQLEVSAAFKGVLKRVISPTVTVEVYLTPPPLPPDPGPAGMTTLQGIDSDHDGVRDDVQRYIALTYPASARTQSALTQLAVALLALINDATNSSQSQLDALEMAYGIECLSATADSNTQASLSALEDQVLNTNQRHRTFIAAEAQASGFSLKLSQTSSSRCIVAPSTLPN